VPAIIVLAAAAWGGRGSAARKKFLPVDAHPEDGRGLERNDLYEDLARTAG
jgi:hypothetical protein